MERLTNARVHEWLTPALDAVTNEMHTTRVQMNSAALWWFLTKLSPQERAEMLGEYTKALAMLGQDEAGTGKGKKKEGGRTSGPLWRPEMWPPASCPRPTRPSS